MKSVSFALAIAALASVISFTAEAVPGDAEDLSGGCWTEGHRWITFGEYDGKPIIWRVLEVTEADDGSRAAFLLAEDAVAEGMKFDDDSNDWDSSYIKKWLNDDFYYAAFSEEEREAILTSTYRYGGEHERSDMITGSKVFLLSADEANDGRFFASDADRAIGKWWWLRSPCDDDCSAASVPSDGKVYGGYYRYIIVDDENAVRPALKINLSSSIFTSSAFASKYEILCGVRVRVRDTDARPIQGAAVAADSPKQKYFTDMDGAVRLEMMLRPGKQKIRVSASGYGVKEFTLDVPRGGGEFTVDMESER